jgi:hypothetical protein
VSGFKYLIILIFILAGFTGIAQPQASHSSLFLFADRDYCISGDTVWFKVEIRNGWRKESNVVHVQLDGGGDRFITGVKKKSNNDWAEGFIHIPDSLSTGVYYFTAFLNTQRAQSSFESVKKSLFVYNRFDEEITEMKVPEPDKRLEATDYSDRISIITDKNGYSPRQKVTVDIHLAEIDSPEVEQVVIRVAHIDDLTQKTGGRFLTGAVSSKPAIPAIEEKNGFVLSGNVTDIASGKPAENVVVLLSLYGEMPYLDYYYTDSSGNFHFFLKNAFGTANAVLQAVDKNGREYDLRIDRNYLVTEPIESQSRILTPEQSELIEDAIDGVFFKKLFSGSYAIETDTFFMPARYEVPFYGPPYERVVPADFFELPNFREISRELLHGVQYRVHDGEVTLRLLNEPENIYFKSDPLRMINGIPVFKNQILARLNSNDIEYVDFVLKERLYGDLNFKGVLSVSLKDKSNSWMTQQPNFFRVPVPCLQPDQEPNYHDAQVSKENLPDVRQVNFWQLAKTGETRQIDFYLSDLKGKVEISVEGVTSNNTIFKSSKIIEVK